MFQSVNFGIINVREPDFEQKLLLAKRHGFRYIETGADEVMRVGVDTVNALLEKHGMAISGANLPFHPITCSQEEFEAKLEKLPEQAAALSAVGCRRCIIWIFPASDTLPMEENYALHKARLSACAKVLAAHGMRLGLEWIGTPLARNGKKYVFLYTAEEMLRLAKDCGDNVGLLFDAFHWYTSAHNKDVFDHIPSADCIVSVHVNDAPDGERTALPDSPRALPGETGNIDIACVMSGLRKLGYDGPVVAEPFSPKLAEMESDDERTACIKSCLDRIMA